MKTIFLCLFVLFGLRLNAQPLQFQSDAIDRGTTTWYHPITAVYKFRNVSGTSLTIVDVDPGCGCMQPSWTQEVIPANGEGEVTVTYVADLLGSFDRLIAITTDVDGNAQFVRMKCKVVAEQVEQQPQKGLVVQEEPLADTHVGPQLGVPSMWEIGAYQANKNVKGAVIIKNEGDELLLIDAIESQNAALNVKNTQLALKPGKYYKIKYTVNTLHIFSPSEPLKLKICSNDPLHPVAIVSLVFQ